MSPRVDYAAVVDRLVDAIKELNEPCAAADAAAAAFAEHRAAGVGTGNSEINNFRPETAEAEARLLHATHSEGSVEIGLDDAEREERVVSQFSNSTEYWESSKVAAFFRGLGAYEAPRSARTWRR